jgi:hypothetical protein
MQLSDWYKVSLVESVQKPRCGIYADFAVNGIYAETRNYD